MAVLFELSITNQDIGSCVHTVVHTVSACTQEALWNRLRTLNESNESRQAGYQEAMPAIKMWNLGRK